MSRLSGADGLGDVPLRPERTTVNMKKCNISIRVAMMNHDLTQWDVAKLLEVSESTFYRMMRDELPEDEQKRIVALIEGGGDHGDK